MPFLIKSHLRTIEPTRAPSVEFEEWSYEGARPIIGEGAVWFTTETSGGFGLYATGRISSNSEDAGKNAKNNSLVRFTAEFNEFEPDEPLGNADFQRLGKLGEGSPIQKLNKRLYMNSHVKVAEIDNETLEFLLARF